MGRIGESRWLAWAILIGSAAAVVGTAWRYRPAEPRYLAAPPPGVNRQIKPEWVTGPSLPEALEVLSRRPGATAADADAEGP